MAKTDLTAERLRELLHYDPDTGVFRWVAARPNCRSGEQAGCTRENGHVIICLDGKLYYAHRLAWLYVHGAWPSKLIDHINGNRSDNRIQNLRDVEPSVNAQNIRQAFKTNASGVLGASLFKRTGRYVAMIRIDGKKRYLGYFDTAEEAHAAYLAAKRKHHQGCTI